MASAQAVREALGLKKMLGKFGIKAGAMPIFTDRHSREREMILHLQPTN